MKTAGVKLDWALACIILVSFVFSCQQKEESLGKDKLRFTLLDASQTNITFSNDLKETKAHNILKYANYYGGAGVGIGDFNNDGLQDIFFAGNTTADKLYLNKGKMRFDDVSQKAGIKNDGGWSTGVTLADVNNDGHLDIYVSRELYDDKPEWRTNQLYLNNGDATFVEVAEKWGVADQNRTRHATFFDYNKDGLLDLFLLTQPPNPGSLSQLLGTDLQQSKYSLRLLKNIGTSFKEVTKEAGLFKTGFPNAVSASDINNDGWTDLYVSNDFYAPDFIFLNNQDGTFTETAKSALPHMSYYSMGVDVADVNNDSQLDVFVLDMVAEDNFRLKSNMSGMDRQVFWDVYNQGGHYQYMYNTFHLNNGNGTFSDVAQFMNLAATDWSWANLIADFDNDGLKDIYVTNGLLRDIRNTDADKAVAKYLNKARFNWVKNHPNGGEINDVFDIVNLDTVLAMIPSQPLKNYAFKNKGDLSFTKTMEEWGLDTASFSNGAAYADLDNDGDLDLVVNNINAPAFVYRNNTVDHKEGHYIRLKLESESDKNNFGTRVNLYTNKGTQTFETTNVRGIYSTSENMVHFGIGPGEQIDSLNVLWPDGKKSKLTGIPLDTFLLVQHSQAQLASRQIPKVKKLFKEYTAKMETQIRHQENDFDDFGVQVLMPHKLSQFGPALAVSDVNADGLDDLFFGGATGYPSKLLLQTANGGFKESNTALWNKESPYEDVDAVFLDVNNDGHQDLFVVSGGNEFKSNDFHYTDRLYINDGKGSFRKGQLLNVNRESGAMVSKADFDNDGDIDLFVGSRHTPHDYPKPASSAIYRNENGQLVNRTKELAPELLKIGMVTDGLWADVDNDQDLDLVIVGEWMPITIFKNQNGSFTKTVTKGLDNTSGWWFSLTAGDFDNDGDTDFIAGNLGLNYKYKTSKTNPFDIYYDDFDGNGKKDIVLGYYNNGIHYPLRGFSCSSEQVPKLKEEFKKYDVFASLDMEEAYGKANLEGALHYKADTFASVYVENRGEGGFKITNLPNMAQLTNINDMEVQDFNGDGNLDVLCVGNLFVSEIETPRNDAGTGLVLLGNGKGGFTNLGNRDSGLFAKKDAKKMVRLNLNGEELVVIANNNGLAQFFLVN